MRRSISRWLAIVAAVAALYALPAMADTRLAKNLKLGSGGKLTIQSDAGGIEITGSSSSSAHLVLPSAKEQADFDARFDFKTEELPNELRITLRKKDSFASWSSSFNNARIKMTLEVPAKTLTDLSTGGGHISLRSLGADTKADTSGGHIEISD